jgi:hypothetical protein
MHARVKKNLYSENPNLAPHKKLQISEVVYAGSIGLDAQCIDPKMVFLFVMADVSEGAPEVSSDINLDMIEIYWDSKSGVPPTV